MSLGLSSHYQANLGTHEIESFQSHACPDLLDNEMRVLDSSNTQNLCEYEDNVILVVNVASRCGYTYQYEGLQSLYDNYKDSGPRIFIIVIK